MEFDERTLDAFISNNEESFKDYVMSLFDTREIREAYAIRHANAYYNFEDVTRGEANDVVAELENDERKSYAQD